MKDEYSVFIPTVVICWLISKQLFRMKTVSGCWDNEIQFRRSSLSNRLLDELCTTVQLWEWILQVFKVPTAAMIFNSVIIHDSKDFINPRWEITFLCYSCSRFSKNREQENSYINTDRLKVFNKNNKNCSCMHVIVHVHWLNVKMDTWSKMTLHYFS